MISIYLVILVWLTFPMFVVYDEKERARLVACGLLYHIIDVFFKNRGDN